MGTSVVEYGAAAGAGSGEVSDIGTGSRPCGVTDGKRGAESGEREGEPPGEEGSRGAEDGVDAWS